MTLSDHKGHFCCLKPFDLPCLRKCSMYCLQYVYSPTASPFKYDFSYSCAAVDKISTDVAHRAVLLRQLSLLLLACLMDQYCSSGVRRLSVVALCRLSSSVRLPAGGSAAAERVGTRRGNAAGGIVIVIFLVGGPDTRITNPRCRTAAILEKSKNHHISTAV